MHFTYTVLSVISFACIAAGADPTCDVTVAKATAYWEAIAAAGDDPAKIVAACDDLDGFKNFVTTLTKCGNGIEDTSTKICLPEECKVSEYADVINDNYEEVGSTCRITFSSTTSTTCDPTEATLAQQTAYWEAIAAAGDDPAKIAAACDDLDGFENFVYLTKCGNGIEDISTKQCLPLGCKLSTYADVINDRYEEHGSTCRITFSSTTSTAFSRVSIIGGMILAGAVAMV